MLYINKLDDSSLDKLKVLRQFNVKQFRTIQCEKSYLVKLLVKLDDTRTKILSGIISIDGTIDFNI